MGSAQRQLRWHKCLTKKKRRKNRRRRKTRRFAVFALHRRAAMSDRPMKLDDRLALSVAEAAESIGVSERHLRSMLSEIPHTYLGNRIVIPVEPFKDWLRESSISLRLTSNQVANEIVAELHSSHDEGQP